MSATIINIMDFERTCRNYIYRNENAHGDEICIYPGGWTIDMRKLECEQFVRKAGKRDHKE